MESNNDKSLKVNRKEYLKDYYENNKEKYKEVIKCDICGAQYSLSNKSHHKNFKKHQMALVKLENEKIKKELDELKKRINE